jgi:hypothetical protein
MMQGPGVRVNALVRTIGDGLEDGAMDGSLKRMMLPPLIAFFISSWLIILSFGKSLILIRVMMRSSF